MSARILLVDDEDEVLDAWETTLKPLKHYIFKAHDEAEALAAASEHPFELGVGGLPDSFKDGRRNCCEYREKNSL